MNSKRLTILLPLLVVVTMLASLITPSPVLAAGEPPPPPGEKSPKSAPAVTKPAPPSSDASYSAEAPLAAPDGAASAAPVALSVDALAQAGAVLVGADGSILPLAAQESVVPLGGGGLVSFKGSGGSECTAGYCYYGDIATALTYFPVRSGSGMIYAPGGLVEPGAVNVVNPLSLNLTKLTGLAWDGKDSHYTPTINAGLLTISNMLKGFTVDGFYIGQGIEAYGNAGTLRFQNLRVTNTTLNGTGIKVYNHTGNIGLFNVTVYNTAYDGAYLDNTAGTGNVTISNSSFNGNLRYGIHLFTHGSALLDHVDASNNQGWDGANLTVMKGATVKDSRFNGNLNTSNGLVIYNFGTGAVNLTNVEAQGNTWDGLSLHAASDISINGALLASNKSSYGAAAVYSGGNITLNNINSLNNKYSVVASNYDPAGPVKTVTVTNSRFTGTTAGDGLQVMSKGNVTLNHIVAEGNHGNGITIDNAQLAGGIYTGSGSVSLLNTLGGNELINNTGFALDVKSKGAITVKGLYADDGLNLDGCAVDPAPPHYCLSNGNLSVTATRVISSGNDASLYAMAGGAITLTGDTFLGNMGGLR